MTRYTLRNPKLEAVQVGDMWCVMVPHAGRLWFTAKQFRDQFVAVPEHELEEGVTIRIPTTPAPFLAPNFNTGMQPWVAAAARKEKARLRKQSSECAEQFRVSIGLSAPMFADDAQVFVTVAWEKRVTKKSPNGRVRSYVDNHDAMPIMCKGIIDGLVDGGILADDRRIRTNFQQIRDPEKAGYVEVKVMP